MAVLVSDSFNRANTTSGLGTTDSYNGGTTKTWTPSNANLWGISNNQAYQAAVYGTDDFNYVDAGVSDNVRLSIDLPNKGNTSGIIFRFVNSSNYFRIVFDGITLYLQRTLSGSRTTLASTPLTATSPYTISVELTGTTIKVYYNGVLKLTTTDSNFTSATNFGLTNWNSSATRFDNFNVESLDTGTPTGTDGSVAFDLRQSLYSDGAVNGDTKQFLFADGAVNFDTLQQVYQGGVDGSISFDLFVQLYSQATVQTETKQTLYSDSQTKYDTKQAFYQDGFFAFDTLQQFNDWLDASTSFDLKIGLYSDGSTDLDTMQSYFQDGSDAFDLLQNFVEYSGIWRSDPKPITEWNKPEITLIQFK